MERTLQSNEQEYKNLKAVAAMLEALSAHGATYIVEDVYLDFGQKWMWTTILRKGFAECQILSPRQWKMITTAEKLNDLVICVEDIMNDKYFMDK